MNDELWARVNPYRFLNPQSQEDIKALLDEALLTAHLLEAQIDSILQYGE